jgi:uncharacterized protein YbaP (TraB family)
MLRALAFIVATIAMLVPSPAAEKTIEATPAMFVAHGPAGTVYLLGSMHRLPKGVHWQTPEILAAMKRANRFVFEIPMDSDSQEKAALTMRDNAIFPATMALPSYFDDKTREDFRSVLMRYQINPRVVVHLRPWLAAVYLEGAAENAHTSSGETVDGVDDQIYAWARQHKIRNFGALESVDDQLSAVKGGRKFDDEMKLFRLMLASLLAAKPNAGPGARFDAWARGDVKALAALGPDDATVPIELRKPLLEDRNRRWIPQIEEMLHQPRITFITVGAAHLVGKTGVPALLRAKGYVVDDPGSVAVIAGTPDLRLSQAR